MKIDEHAFIEAIESENFEKSKSKIKLNDLKENIKESLKPLDDFIAKNIKDNKIASAELEVEKKDIKVRLETSIINLPLEYGPQINKIMVNDGEVPVNVYMIIQNPYVTHSKMRIDEMGTSEEVANDPDGNLLDKFTKWLDERLVEIETNIAKEKDSKKDNE